MTLESIEGVEDVRDCWQRLSVLVTLESVGDVGAGGGFPPPRIHVLSRVRKAKSLSPSFSLALARARWFIHERGGQPAACRQTACA